MATHIRTRQENKQKPGIKAASSTFSPDSAAESELSDLPDPEAEAREGSETNDGPPVVQAQVGEYQCWLMKAEPDTRMVKGKDVAFSVDHFEKMGVSQWDGVRNALAKRYMKEDMKMGDKVLFYHSNCKTPGVAALAEVVKEGYPDWSAWDPEHPYYDPKTKKDSPTWFMVDVKFVERLPHLVPLSLYKNLADLVKPPAELAFLTPEHLEAIQRMPLINKGRLSVQPVSKEAYEATVLLGRSGGFADYSGKAKGKAQPKQKNVAPKKSIPKRKKRNAEEEEGAEDQDEADGEEADEEEVLPAPKKRQYRKKA